MFTRKHLLAVCLGFLCGCGLLDDYSRGYRTAVCDARQARRDYGVCAPAMMSMLVLMPGHVSADKSEDWRKGYADGFKAEFKDGPPLPTLPQ
jgi:hypothetical protein